MDNAEEYVDLMFDFCMHTGIQKQMEAFRGNFTYGRIYVQLGGLIGAQGVLVSSGGIEWLSKTFKVKIAVGKILISSHFCSSYAIFNIQEVPFTLIKKLLIDSDFIKI